MASTVTTDAHGVRVVTQVIPLVSPETVQCPGQNKDSKTKVPEAPYMTRMFLKGEPVALGVSIAIHSLIKFLYSKSQNENKLCFLCIIASWLKIVSDTGKNILSV